MIISVINEGLKKAVIDSLTRDDFASLPECIQRSQSSKNKLFMKYDEIQIKIKDDSVIIHNCCENKIQIKIEEASVIIHQCYKNEVINSITHFLLHDQSLENVNTLCIYDLDILMKSGKKANAIEIDFANSSRSKISFIEIKKKNNQKKVRFVQQFNWILKDIHSFSEFQYGLHTISLT